MSVALPDVNVLVALLDPAHPNHDAAHAWFRVHRSRGWATTPLTINGCVRVLSNPAYPTVECTPAEVVESLKVIMASPSHCFWPDTLSVADESAIHPQLLSGHSQITDACLLALAVANDGRLVTFDRRIPVKAVAGARPAHVDLLSPQRH
ncbi:MAG: VapC toxin family PIN domain ribonuclease [Candidatus Solibacter usitatus]|nr:VapC toxin family PIN domain ribonuclease [Candidatus Solibacter usitatus]